jgi:curved DNA-binding protein CbpA/Ca2+-binding EF-hand superfamily protein
MHIIITHTLFRFLSQALQCHPDRQSTDEDREKAHHIFAKVSAAYDTVTDPVKRYDWHQANEHGKKKAAASGRRAPTPPGTPFNKTPPRNQFKTHSAPPPPPKRQGPNNTGPTNTSPKPRYQHPPPPPPRKATTAPTLTRPEKHHSAPSHPKKHHPGQSPNNSLSSSSHHRHRPSPTSTTNQDGGGGGVKGTSPSKPSPSGGGHTHPPPPPPPKNRSTPTTAPTTTTNTTSTSSSKSYRDPFVVFENVMKDEFGDNYREEEKSGWMDSLGISGLNPFKNLKLGSSGGGGSTGSTSSAITPHTTGSSNTGGHQESSKKEFKKLDVNNDRTLSHDELRRYIESHADLWKMLGMNLNLSVTRCIEVATDVAYSLALGRSSPADGVLSRPTRTQKVDQELSEKEFIHFHKTYVLDAAGSHEFFLRTIFAVFDTNGDGVLNRTELDRFLDLFYQAKDIFRGSKRLPPKRELLSIVQRRLDTNRDSVLEYGEIRDLLEVAAFVSAASENTIVGQ